MTSVSEPEYDSDWEATPSHKMKKQVFVTPLSSAQMPSESSSVVCNATNGVEPPK